ncbi:hypothetical protein ACHAXM_002184 [Skeletonema potamos]
MAANDLTNTTTAQINGKRKLVEASCTTIIISEEQSPLSSLLPPPQIRSIITQYLQDDIPSHFDVGGHVVGNTIQTAELWMKSPGVLAGIPFFNATFDVCGSCQITWEPIAIEGQSYHPNNSDNKIKLATVTGPVSHLLRGERTALNTLSRCSGVATLSNQCVQIAKSNHWKGLVAGTRKTTPGFRLVEKYGLLVGGAATHRLDLSQMVMLKDNHVWACDGSIERAVKKARAVSGFSQKIEVECQSLSEAIIAAEAGADVVMLDNFEPDQLKKDAKVFKEKFPHVTVEASGGITMETMPLYFSEHVDVISQGKLTQGYDCVDFSLKIVH